MAYDDNKIICENMPSALGQASSQSFRLLEFQFENTSSFYRACYCTFCDDQELFISDITLFWYLFSAFSISDMGAAILVCSKQGKVT